MVRMDRTSIASVFGGKKRRAHGARRVRAPNTAHKATTASMHVATLAGIRRRARPASVMKGVFGGGLLAKCRHRRGNPTGRLVVRIVPHIVP